MEQEQEITKVVVDTDICIDFFRTNSGLFPSLIKLQEEYEAELYFSSITIFELFSGSSSKDEEDIIMGITLQVKTIPFDFVLAKFAGELKRDRKLKPPLGDFIIGSTALYPTAKLGTRNKAHFLAIPNLKFFELPND